ncbi:PIR Superfamily Protein [Plasmodium ovale curtisi]|uniref:PIR Superfamily Protein n=1 Tax=Plasmodium ovale curtisi TaxID=864141 RepID=A0A1A8X3V8_PLAOA|nr:PIR Superfamily Protein [Plasmodium ovale curtisi]
MSSRINTAYNVASSHNEYKTKLDSYIDFFDPSYMPGCEDFANQHINVSKYNAPKVCTIALRFLTHLKEENIPSYQEDGCLYLYYWLHTEAVNSKTSIENTLDLYKKLYEIYNTDNDGDNKFDKYMNKINKDTCDKLEKLIGLYELFKKFERQYESKTSVVNCNSECVTLFASYVHECQTGYDNEFCKELRNFREGHNVFIQKVLRCNGEKYLLPPVENFDAIGMVIIPLTLILVTSFIFPLLYKFTPFGPWIRHKIGKKGNMWDNINEETHQLLDTDEMEKNKSKMRDYNIAYISS